MRRRDRRRRSAVAAAVLLLAATLGGGAVATERLLVPAGDGEVLTLLLLGSDDGPPRGGSPVRARADGFQLLFVSGDRQHATFVSIPRDAWVPVPGLGTNRINACLNGGPERCVATVESVFDVQVDGYLVTSMDAFKSAFEDFGRITVDVPTPVSDGGAAIPSAGEQRLTGSQTLTYARDRKNRGGGDFSRSQAQAEVLAIAHRDVVAAGSVTRTLEAVSILRRHTVTDLAPDQLVRLAFEAMRLPPEQVQRELAPGFNSTAGAAAVVRLEDRAYRIVADAADDGRVGDG